MNGPTNRQLAFMRVTFAFVSDDGSIVVPTARLRSRSIVVAIFLLPLGLAPRSEGGVASFLNSSASFRVHSLDLRQLFRSSDNGIVSRSRFSVPRLPDLRSAAHVAD